MNNFIPKKINSTINFGNKLREAREFNHLKISDIAKELDIDEKYLNALEEEDLDKLPSGLYGRSYLKKYSNFLHLNSQELIENWDKLNSNNTQSDPFSQKIIQKHKFIVFPKIVRNIMISLAVLVCFLYLIFYFKKIILPPELIIDQPRTNISTTDHSITIIGHTNKEAEVKINGDPVLNNNNGYFNKTINLKNGLNSITIEAKKRYSRDRVIIKQILVKE